MIGANRVTVTRIEGARLDVRPLGATLGILSGTALRREFFMAAGVAR